jgi:hypothetical protein
MATKARFRRLLAAFALAVGLVCVPVGPANAVGSNSGCAGSAANGWVTGVTSQTFDGLAFQNTSVTRTLSSSCFGSSNSNWLFRSAQVAMFLNGSAIASSPFQSNSFGIAAVSANVPVWPAGSGTYGTIGTHQGRRTMSGTGATLYSFPVFAPGTTL